MQIDKGVPMPPIRKRCSQAQRDSKWSRVLMAMDEGDSVVVTVNQKVGFYLAARRHRIVISVRRQEDGTYRVWRTE